MTNYNLFIKWSTQTVFEAGWAPALLLVCYAIVALVFNGYDRYPYLDIPTHFLGGVAVSFFYRIGVQNAEEFIGRIPGPAQAILVFSCLSATAIFWEFYEFLADYFVGTSLQNGTADTLCDLLFGMLGSLAYLAISKRPELSSLS